MDFQYMPPMANPAISKNNSGFKMFFQNEESDYKPKESFISHLHKFYPIFKVANIEFRFGKINLIDHYLPNNIGFVNKKRENYFN